MGSPDASDFRRLTNAELLERIVERTREVSGLRAELARLREQLDESRAALVREEMWASLHAEECEEA